MHMLWVQVDDIQMGTHNICLYKEVDKMYTACNLKTTKSLDCALIGVCAVIRSNMVIEIRYMTRDRNSQGQSHPWSLDFGLWH